jgi:hypothetical protein
VEAAEVGDDHFPNRGWHTASRLGQQKSVLIISYSLYLNDNFLMKSSEKNIF